MEEGCIVLDIGSYSCKAGWSGEDTPRGIFPTVTVPDMKITKSVDSAGAVGKNSDIKKIGGMDGNVSFFNGGDGDGFSVKHVVERGRIVDFDGVEKILEHVFANELDTGIDALGVPVSFLLSYLNHAKKYKRRVLFPACSPHLPSHLHRSLLSFRFALLRFLLLSSSSSSSSCLPRFCDGRAGAGRGVANLYKERQGEAHLYAV